MAAANNLLPSQPDLFCFTSQTNQTEWNLAHHFANELHRCFPRHSCDLDVSKANFKYKRPDIIIHRRDSHKANLLVVEVKRIRSQAKRELKKITRNWFRPPLSYQFGAVVVINEYRDPYFELIENS